MQKTCHLWYGFKNASNMPQNTGKTAPKLKRKEDNRMLNTGSAAISSNLLLRDI